MKVFISYGDAADQVTALRLQALGAVNGLTVYVPPAYTRQGLATLLDPEAAQKLNDAEVVFGRRRSGPHRGVPPGSQRRHGSSQTHDRNVVPSVRTAASTILWAQPCRDQPSQSGRSGDRDSAASQNHQRPAECKECPFGLRYACPGPVDPGTLRLNQIRMRARRCTIDSSCVIALDHLDLVPKLSFLFSIVLVPKAVREELLKHRAAKDRLQAVFDTYAFFQRCDGYEQGTVDFLLAEPTRPGGQDRGEVEAVVQASQFGATVIVDDAWGP